MGAGLVHFSSVRCGDDRVLDEVAGETQVAFVGRARGPSEHLVEAAGEPDPLAGLLGTGAGQEVVGLAVVPAAIAAPDVAHDELRDGRRPAGGRAVEEVRRDLDLVQDAVEWAPCS